MTQHVYSSIFEVSNNFYSYKNKLSQSCFFPLSIITEYGEQQIDIYAISPIDGTDTDMHGNLSDDEHLGDLK